MPDPPRDPKETAAQLERWLPTVLEDAREVRVDMEGGPANTGFSSDTLMFDVEWSGTAGTSRESLVARLQPTGFTVFPISHYDVGAQFRVMQSLADSDVPVPRMRWNVTDESILGTVFYVMDRVEGRVPTDNPPLHQGGWVQELPVVEREQLWWNGLEALCRVHCLDWRALGFDFLDRPERGPDPLSQLLDTYAVFRDWDLARERYPLIERALDWLHGSQPKDEPVTLCWGDSRLANQIFQDIEVAAVLDWEMAHLGSPVHDLAWWITIDRCVSEGIGLERLEGMPGRDATVERWQERTGRTADHLEYYEILSAFQFSVIMARIGMQMKHHGLLPDDHTMDRDNLASLTLERMMNEVRA